MRAYIGLGSNLDNPRAHVERALEELAALASTRMIAASPLYRSRPLGPPDQPDYINAVAALETSFAPMQLLERLQRLERRHGRVPGGERWGPRPLDLDLLICSQQRIDTARLAVPHPQLSARAFVLYPLADIAPPTLRIPGYGRLAGLLARVSGDDLQKLN